MRHDRQTIRKQIADTYFDTMSEAINHAFDSATERGYVVQPHSALLSPVSYGRTGRYTFDLTKDGKWQRKALHVILYRMESGKYELTHYIN